MTIEKLFYDFMTYHNDQKILCFRRIINAKLNVHVMSLHGKPICFYKFKYIYNILYCCIDACTKHFVLYINISRTVSTLP